MNDAPFGRPMPAGSDREWQWELRQRKARQQWGSARALRVAACRPPSVMAATTLRAQLGQFVWHADGEAAAVARRALTEADNYIRDMGRESWRRPGPAAYESLAEKVLQAARIAEEAAAAVLKEPPPPPLPPEESAAAEVADSREAAPEGSYRWYDNPFLYQDCYRGTLSLRHTDVPPVVAERAVERELRATDLDDAYVHVEDDRVVAYWAPDEHEEWERDLLLTGLEDAAQAVGLPPTRAKVRWLPSHGWDRITPR